MTLLGSSEKRPQVSPAAQGQKRPWYDLVGQAGTGAQRRAPPACTAPVDALGPPQLLPTRPLHPSPQQGSPPVSAPSPPAREQTTQWTLIPWGRHASRKGKLDTRRGQENMAGEMGTVSTGPGTPRTADRCRGQKRQEGPCPGTFGDGVALPGCWLLASRVRE